SSYGSDVEDHPIALSYHLFVDRLGNGEEAVDVRVDDFIPRAIRSRCEIVASINRGVVDQNIYPAPFFDQFSRDSFHAQAVGYRNLEAVSTTTVCGDFSFNLFCQIFARVEAEGHVCALAREDLADCATNAACAARDERTLAFKQKTQL